MMLVLSTDANLPILERFLSIWKENEGFCSLLGMREVPALDLGILMFGSASRWHVI